jgi:formylglycine-generating enzyme required for sulfatase activity
MKHQMIHQVNDAGRPDVPCAADGPDQLFGQEAGTPLGRRTRSASRTSEQPKTMNVKELLSASLLLFALPTQANNLQMSAPTVNPGASTISFTISWDNSWNVAGGAANWDGVWVFVKRQACSDRIWNHALLSTTSADHDVNGGVLQVDAVADGMGVFVRRAATGQGNIATATVTLRMQTAPNNVDNFRVFGVEMVNIPQGDFLIGDGTGGWNNANFCPQWITAARQAAGMGASGNYVCWNGGMGSSASLPATFPLGWNRFYTMKYEVSQEQYADFLNTLTFNQQVNRTAVAPHSAVGTTVLTTSAPSSRSSIRIAVSGLPNEQPAVYGCDLNGNGTFNEAADGQNIACNWLSWADLTTYLDWAALRPMTEFEYEKICRGAAGAVLANDHAWSTTALTQVNAGALNNGGAADEVPTTTGPGLCAMGSGNAAHGPLRCGFAATASTGRVAAGATFYGVMDMTGNVWEQAVGGWGFNYSGFTTASGDGTLTANGAANTAGWPPVGGNNGGAVVRGGAWNNATGRTVSGRADAMSLYIPNNGRDRAVGGRGVRNW